MGTNTTILFSVCFFFSDDVLHEKEFKQAPVACVWVHVLCLYMHYMLYLCMYCIPRRKMFEKERRKNVQKEDVSA